MGDDAGPSIEIRAFIAVVLSLAVMLGYQYFFSPPPVAPPEVVQDGEGTVSVPPPESTPPATAESPERAPEPEEARGAVGDTERRLVTLETDVYQIALDNRGAQVTSLILRQFAADFGGPLELVVRRPEEPSVGLFALASAGNGVVRPANEALYRLTVDGREPPTGSTIRISRNADVRWEWNDGNGWNVEKRLTVTPDGYLSNFWVRAQNPNREPLFVTLGPGLVMNPDNSRVGIYLMRGAVYFDGADVTHIADDELAERQVMPVDLAWGGIESNYFVALFAPRMRTTVSMLADIPLAPATDGDEAAAGEGQAGYGTLATFGLLVPPGEAIETPVFLGPKSYTILANAGFGLERAVDYGFFRVIARPVALGLEWLYARTGNYGVAIILATLLVRIVFFPLTQSSMKSMRKMQQLQPQMNAIRARYKGVKDSKKRQQMNTEVMQLYKDEGVSPLGGCVPMLLQMPVLFAFYAAISVSIIARQAPFTLWITDLSKMDPYYVLPLLMGASMYAQQRMSPGTGDPMQQRIFRLMPVMFTFFFLTFPSGLVIYWLMNTVLGIGQQAYVNHQLAAPEAAAKTAHKGKKKPNAGPKGGGAKRKKRGK